MILIRKQPTPYLSIIENPVKFRNFQWHSVSGLTGTGISKQQSVSGFTGTGILKKHSGSGYTGTGFCYHFGIRPENPVPVVPYLEVYLLIGNNDNEHIR